VLGALTKLKRDFGSARLGVGRNRGTLIITLLFPNSSRSLDEKRNAVRFTGHDGVFEMRFFVEADALVTADAELGRSETKLLSAFDVIACVHP
jgi:hypothetical protein